MPKEASSATQGRKTGQHLSGRSGGDGPVGENDLMGNNAIQGETPRTRVEAVASKRQRDRQSLPERGKIHSDQDTQKTSRHHVKRKCMTYLWAEAMWQSALNLAHTAPERRHPIDYPRQ